MTSPGSRRAHAAHTGSIAVHSATAAPDWTA